MKATFEHFLISRSAPGARTAVCFTFGGLTKLPWRAQSPSPPTRWKTQRQTQSALGLIAREVLHDLDRQHNYPIILASDPGALAQSQLGPLLAAGVRGQCCPRHARLDRRWVCHEVIGPADGGELRPAAERLGKIAPAAVRITHIEQCALLTKSPRPLN